MEIENQNMSELNQTLIIHSTTTMGEAKKVGRPLKQLRLQSKQNGQTGGRRTELVASEPRMLKRARDTMREWAAQSVDKLNPS